MRESHWRLEAYLDYELLSQLYLEAALRAESIDDALNGTDRYVAPLVTLRWGLPFKSLRY